MYFNYLVYYYYCEKSFFDIYLFIGSPWEVTIMSGGSYSPKLSVLGDAVKLVPVDSVTIFQISAIGFHREDVQVNVLSEFLL